MPFDAMLSKLEDDLRTAVGISIMGFVKTARTQLEDALAEVGKERAKGIADVAKERTTLQREIVAMQKQQEAQQGRVVLDIGGHRYTTSVQTLRRLPGTFFDAYFSGRYAQDVCEDGSIFIDRDGTYFGHVLEYLRDGVVSAGLEERQDTLLLREFEFFSVEPVVEQDFMIAMGGRNGSKVLANVDRYDAKSGLWEQLAPMPGVGLASFGLAGPINGQLYLSGGWDGSNYVSAVQKYSVEDDAWTNIAPMPGPRYRHQAYAVGKSIYVIGGQNELRQVVTDACRYDTQTGVWSTCPALPEVRRFFSGCVVGQFIYVVGGWDADCLATDSVFRFDARSISWERLPVRLPKARFACGVCVLDGAVYVAGGRDSTSATVSTVYRLDASTGTWSNVAPMSTARAGIQLVALDGCLYASGGVLGGVGGEERCDLVERYDPENRAWLCCAPLRISRLSYRALTIGIKVSAFRRRSDEEGEEGNSIEETEEGTE